MRGNTRPGGIAVFLVVGLLSAVAGCAGSASPYPGGSPPPPYLAPGGIAVTAATYTTLAFRWTAPADGYPPPSDYKIVLNGSHVATLRGTATSYRATGLAPGTTYAYQVGADWATASAALSNPLAGQTLDPPLSGDTPVNVRVVSIPSGDGSYHVGETLFQDWSFSASCTSGGCSETAQASLQDVNFSIPLHRSGNGYAGSAKARVTECMSGSSGGLDTVSLTLSPAKGGVVNGAWRHWSGVFVDATPRDAPSAGGPLYCPAQSWTFAVTPQQVPAAAAHSTQPAAATSAPVAVPSLTGAAYVTIPEP